MASDGEEGLKKALEEEHLLLIVLDILVPKKSGWSMFGDLTQEGKGTVLVNSDL